MSRALLLPSDLVKVADRFPWPERPSIGEAVQLNSGGPRMVILYFDRDDGDHAICEFRNADDTAELECFPWVCLKPWVTH